MEISIVAGVLCHQGRLLLGKRSAHRRAYPGVWDLPGGHVEPGETVERALVRELREELGVTATAWRELGVFRAPAMGDERGHTLRMQVFLVTKWRGEPRNLQTDEHDEIAWLTSDEAAGLTLAYDGYPALFRAAVEASR